MAEKELTPEGISGIPLLVAPSSPFIELPLDNPRVADGHHGVHVDAHKKRAYFGTLAGSAIRNIQLELLEVELHNFGTETYHDFYKGILLPSPSGLATPQSDCDVFSRLVPSVAGHIHREVIDLNDLRTDEEGRRRPVIRPMTDDEFDFFTQPHPEGLRPYKHVWFKQAPVYNFLKYYMRTRNFGPQYMEKLADLFKTDEPEERRAIGYLVLGRLIEVTPKRVAKDTPLEARANLLVATAEPEARVA